MGMTMIENLLARKAGLAQVRAGDTVTVEVDMCVMIDLQFATLWMQPSRIHDPAKVAVIMDHAVPAPTLKDAEGGPKARKFVADFGIEKFFDVGRHGICHQVIAENGLARPGEVLACTDSHTCAGGPTTPRHGVWALSRCSPSCVPGQPGSRWHRRCATNWPAAKPDGVSGKDIFLFIANAYGDATNQNLEFGGPGVASIPLNDRRTIATQGAEVSADFSTFGVDDVLREFLRRARCHRLPGRRRRPGRRVPGGPPGRSVHA